MNHSLTRQITLTEALALLASAAAVIVDSDYVTYAQFPEDEDSTDGADAYVLEVAQNSQSGAYIEQFTAAANPTVSLTDGRLTMTNAKGQQTSLRPLFERHDEPAAKVHTQGVIVEVGSEATADFSLFTSTRYITAARLQRFLAASRGLEFAGEDDEPEDSITLVDAADLKPVDLDAAEAAL